MSQITVPVSAVPGRDATPDAAQPASPAASLAALKALAMASPNRIGLRPVQIRLSTSREGYTAPVYPHPVTGQNLWTVVCLYDKGEKGPDGRTVWYTRWKVCLVPSLFPGVNPPRRNLTKNQGSFVWISDDADRILSEFTHAFSAKQDTTLDEGLLIADAIFSKIAVLPDCVIPETFIAGFGKPSDSRLTNPSTTPVPARVRVAPQGTPSGVGMPLEHSLDGDGY